MTTLDSVSAAIKVTAKELYSSSTAVYNHVAGFLSCMLNTVIHLLVLVALLPIGLVLWINQELHEGHGLLPVQVEKRGPASVPAPPVPATLSAKAARASKPFWSAKITGMG
jgi:hypothetical protein